MKHTLNISNGAKLLLRSALSRAGWAVTIEDIYVGGKILIETLALPDGIQLLADTDPTVSLEWASEKSTCELTEDERDCCKRCLKAAVSKGVIRPGPPMIELIDLFGLMKS